MTLTPDERAAMRRDAEAALREIEVRGRILARHVLRLLDETERAAAWAALREARQAAHAAPGNETLWERLARCEAAYDKAREKA